MLLERNAEKPAAPQIFIRNTNTYTVFFSDEVKHTYGVERMSKMPDKKMEAFASFV